MEGGKVCKVPTLAGHKDSPPPSQQLIAGKVSQICCRNLAYAGVGVFFWVMVI
jgi:hypothetical protein